MAELLEYKCPCCGGAINFDSSLQKLKCPYCDTEYEIDTLKEYDDIINNARPSEMTWDTAAGTEWEAGESDHMLVYVCESCGGEIVCDDDTAATSCPYCDNPVVMSGNLSGELKPDTIIPFKLDKAAAKAAFREYLSDKRLLPTIFKSDSYLDEIKGVYVPVWLFDANAEADMQFLATKDRAWSDSNYNYRETNYYSVGRSGRFSFKNVPVGASSKLERDVLESLEPFDPSASVDFRAAYLAGYMADKYDITAEDCIEHANSRIEQSIETMLSQQVDGEYNINSVENKSIRFNDGRTRYALYPVWMMTAKWNGQLYSFAMNGQTGKFVGDLPMDKKKYWGYFGVIAAVIAALVYAFVHLAASC